MKRHMAGKKNKYTVQINPYAWWACIFMLMLFVPTLCNAATISGKYIPSTGAELTIKINAGSVPPSSVILIQHFPPGVRMIDSRPRASNYNAKNNSAKWLLKGLRPGGSTVRVTLDQPVSSNEVSAEILFRPLDGGKMVTVQVTK